MRNEGEFKIINVGTSKGIRLPKWILEECHFSGVVRYTLQEDGSLVLTAIPHKNKYDLWAESVDRQGGLKTEEIEKLPDTFDQSLLDEWEWPEDEFNRQEPVIFKIVETGNQ